MVREFKFPGLRTAKQRLHWAVEWLPTAHERRLQLSTLNLEVLVWAMLRLSWAVPGFAQPIRYGKQELVLSVAEHVFSVFTASAHDLARNRLAARTAQHDGCSGSRELISRW